MSLLVLLGCLLRASLLLAASLSLALLGFLWPVDNMSAPTAPAVPSSASSAAAAADDASTPTASSSSPSGTAPTAAASPPSSSRPPLPAPTGPAPATRARPARTRRQQPARIVVRRATRADLATFAGSSEADVEASARRRFAAALATPAWLDDDPCGGGARRQAVEGDCPICLSALRQPDAEQEPLVWCRRACGVNMHLECFFEAALARASRSLRARIGEGPVAATCPYCRSRWIFPGLLPAPGRFLPSDDEAAWPPLNPPR